MILAGKYPKSVENLIVFGSNAYIVEEELKIYESKHLYRNKLSSVILCIYVNKLK